MRRFDSEEQIRLFFRCMIDQISLMEACYIDGSIEKEYCLAGIGKFYTIMVKINENLESNGHKPLKFLFMGEEGNS